MAKKTKNRVNNLSTQAKPLPDTDEVATIERDDRVFQGFLDTIENPDEVLRLECGGDITLYDTIGRDARIASNLRTRAQAVIGKEWAVTPYSDDAQDIKVAEYVKQVFLAFPFDTARRSILRGGVLKGFALSEVMWDVSEGDISIKRMQHRAQRRFKFGPDGSLRLMTADNPIEGINLTRQHPQKFQTFTFGDEPETPYGVGLGRELYWPWWFKKNGIKFWLQFCERFGSPTAIGRYPNNASSDKKATLMNALDTMRSNSSITIPEGMNIELLQQAASGSISTQSDLVRYMGDEVSICILGQTASTQGTAGKLGNEESQENVREDLVKSDADISSEWLTQQVVRWLVDYQFPGLERYPLFWIRAGDEADLNRMAERDKTLSETGVKFRKKYFVGAYDLNDDDFDLDEAPKPNTKKTPEFAEGDQEDELEEISAAELADWQPLLKPVLDPVLRAIEEAKDFEDLQRRLAEIANDQQVEPLVTSLATASFKARALGETRDD